ncbi:phage tape measure protein [Ancylobacter novellus DSM 506]|uniref:Phage tape measure protein n=1 Tax=Ancylobacter novellus (strain ATCC 8093 / DSM 506 / JCM 20403 / CCM 1077 / IAM 12100 / NBRC 12443 / NCIMB 10456) TaxID=639283 RepID=D6ZZB7_ANCN5|nr:tape measure protein [Ancylobacter novellus]ADH89253.1 phage tape measure protein [Ancylobacter novellus DSM 506]
MATDLERLVVQLSADIKSYEAAMNRASGITARRAREIENKWRQTQKRLSGIGRDMASGIIAPLSGIGAALGAREIAAYADAWTEAGNKLRAAATSSGVQVRSLNDLKDGANAARTDLESYVDLYAKLIRSASGVAESEQEIAAATQIVAQAFKAGGASAQEQAAGILQLGQALGSGVLQGDELRSLRENAPVIAQAIADEFGVTIAGLKELGAQGELVSWRIFRAILNAQDTVAAQFKATNATIRDGITAVNNEFLAYIGNADSSAGASRGLAQALLSLAANFNGVADAAVAFATVVAGALTGRALAGMVTTLGSAVAALGALLTALRTGAPIAATFTAALGPIGLLAGAAAAALVLLTYRQEGADEAAQAHRKALVDLQDAYAAVRRGSEGAEKKLADLSAKHLEAAKAAITNAKAQLQAAQAVQAAGETTMPAFGPEGLLAPAAQAGFVERNTAAAIALLEKRQTELADLEKRLANPEVGLTTDTSGYGNAPTATSSPKVGRRTADDRFREDIQAVKDRTAALAAEQELIGQSIAAQESRRLQLDLEAQALADLREEARRKGETDLESIQLAPEQVAAIKEVADAYGQQAEALAKAQQAFADANDLAHGFASDLASGLLDGASAADALSNALDNVADKLLDMALNSLFDPNGGVLGGLFKGLTGLATGGPVAGSGGIGHAATGGHISGPGSGTSDSIPMMLSNGEYVVNAKQAKKYAPLLEAINSGTIGTIGKMAGGGLVAPRLPRTSSVAAARAPGAVTVSYAPNVTIEAGASAEAVAQLQRVLAEDRRSFATRTIKTIQEARRRNVGI